MNKQTQSEDLLPEGHTILQNNLFFWDLAFLWHPNGYIQPADFTVHRAKRNRALYGKKKGGGLCFITTKKWCDRGSVQELESLCSTDLEYYPEAVFIVVGNLKSNLRTVLPNYYQHIDGLTPWDSTLDHCYMPFRQGYKANSHPPFGKSDHKSILLLPAFKQRLKREVPVVRSVQRCSD